MSVQEQDRYYEILPLNTVVGSPANLVLVEGATGQAYLAYNTMLDSHKSYRSSFSHASNALFREIAVTIFTNSDGMPVSAPLNCSQRVIRPLLVGEVHFDAIVQPTC